MKTRFDFEQSLMSCWGITDDIADLRESVENNDLRKETIINALKGLESIYSLKFDKLWREFEDIIMPIIRENEMMSEECAAMREQLSDAYDGQGYGIRAIKPNKKAKK